MSQHKLSTLRPQRARRTGSLRRGFTLIEMLIVLVIIGILAAILFPVFSRVREGARTASCSNNLRQLGLAFTQYAQDNDRRFPGAGNYQIWAGGVNGSPLPAASVPPQNGGHWVTGGQGATPETATPKNYGMTGPALALNADPFTYQANQIALPEKAGLFAYTRSASIYVCPSTDDSEEKRLGYSMNCALAGIRDSRIRTPTEIVLLVDEDHSLNDGYFWAVNDPAATDLLTKAHNGGGNLLFCDGHVKFYPFEKFPLDNTTEGLKSKTALTGTPRFHDKAFGSKQGSAYPTPFADPPKPPANPTGNDSCGQPGA